MTSEVFSATDSTVARATSPAESSANEMPPLTGTGVV